MQAWLAVGGRIFPLRFQVSKAVGIKSRSRKKQAKRNSRCCKRWKGLFSLGSPSSPLLPAGRKEGAIGDSGERASEGLLGQLNQRNYFPTDEAKNILMAFS